MKIRILTICLMSLLCSCNINNDEDKFKEFKNTLDLCYDNNDYEGALDSLGFFVRRNPEITENKEILKELNISMEFCKKRLEGRWMIKKDYFGENKCVTNKYRISGSFSNTAVEDARLGVVIDVYEEHWKYEFNGKIEIHLYEYNGNNPVKGGLSDKYVLKFLSSKGNYEYLYLYSREGKLIFDYGSVDIFIDELKSSVMTICSVWKKGNVHTKYKFNVKFHNEEFGKLYKEL